MVPILMVHNPQSEWTTIIMAKLVLDLLCIFSYHVPLLSKKKNGAEYIKQDLNFSYNYYEVDMKTS